MRKFSIFFTVLCFTVFSGFAQKSNINLTVTDALQHPVQGATIHILNTNTNYVTDASGKSVIPTLNKGTFLLEVSASGYATANKTFSAGNNSAGVDVVLESNTTRLSEIVVTAQKKEELLQKVPLSVTALSSKAVQDYRLWNAEDITAISPNLYSAEPGDKRNVSSLRGITSSSYDPAVTTYVDGVNQFNLDTYGNTLFDVERIEVLRGPQGTLYGRNSMGGVINIITKQPGAKTSGFAEASVGNHGQQRYTAGVRVPVVKDKLFFGVAGLYDKRNGFYTNEFNNSRYDDQHNLSGNAYINYKPVDKWSVTLNAKNTANRNNGPFPLVFGVADALANPYKLNQNALTKIIDNIFNTSLSINHTGNGFNLSSQTAYQTNYRYYTNPIDADFSPLDGITLNNNYGNDFNTVKVLTEELKLTSSADESNPFKWAVGTYFFHQDNDVKQATMFGADAAMFGAPDTDFSLINTTKAKSNGIAFYGQGTYPLSQKLDITAGLRYDNEKKEQSILGEYQKDPDPNPVFQTRPDTSATASFNAFSPKVSIAFHSTPQHTLYATYSKGFRAGGLTSLSADPSVPALYAYKPEHSNNIEVGNKARFLNNRLTLNVSAFYSTVTDVQVPTLVLPDAITITTNSGKLTSKGVEAEVNSALAKGLELNYSFGYTDAEYNTLKLAQNGGEVNLKGKKQIFTPDVTSLLAAQYSIGLSQDNTTKVTLRGEWKYLGKQYFDLANTLEQPAYSVFNATAGLSLKNYSILLWGRNLADKKYVSYGYDFGAVHLGNPFTYGATLAARF